MGLFARYIVNENHSFNKRHYPKVVREINRLETSLRYIKSIHETDIVISFLKIIASNQKVDDN